MDILMPQLGESVAEGSVVEWLKKEGERVAKGDVLFEVETDKATMEVEALASGTLVAIRVAAGQTIPVGTVVGVLDSGDLKAAPPAGQSPATPPTLAEAPEAVPEAHVGKGGRYGRAHLGDGRRATPLARRLAHEHGIDLNSVESGRGDGKVRRDDVLAEAGGAIAPAPTTAPTSAPPASAEKPRPLPDIPHRVLPLGAMRKTIARRLTESKQQVPHIYLTIDVRIDALLALREQVNVALAAKALKVSINDMMIKALALSLLEVPECNVRFDEDRLIAFERTDISVAVSVPTGLITPIIVDAGIATLSSIAGRMRDLADRARAGSLQPHEYQGGTASLSNMGMLGIKQFAAVINPPQAMILACGAAERRPIFVGDDVQGATMIAVTGSFDHRAIDGADGARLLGVFRNIVEEPLGLLV